MDINNNTRAGTVGGTLLVTLLSILSNDIIRTIGFAALGLPSGFLYPCSGNFVTATGKNVGGKTMISAVNRLESEEEVPVETVTSNRVLR